MQRSDPLPISVYVVSRRGHSGRVLVPHMLPAIQAIKSCIARIHTLELQIPIILQEQFTGLSSSALHSFTLNTMVNMGMMDYFQPKVYDIKSLTAGVKKMNLEVLAISRVLLSCDSLVDLKVVGLAVNFRMKILRQTPLIQKLVALTIPPAANSSTNNLVLKHLQELEFTFEKIDIISLEDDPGFLDCLILPSLKSLTCSGHARKLIQLLQRSCAPLEKLELHSMGTPDSHKTILALLPGLKVLSLFGGKRESIKEVFGAIVGKSLQKFTYECDEIKAKPNWSFVIHCLQATPSLQHLEMNITAAPSRLTRKAAIKLESEIWMDKDTVEGFKNLRAEGRRITIQVLSLEG
ncbi:hypothetical protein CPB83DRAFT_683004 [Crepidotus variabilis]|uniref:FBD domain-containing protein n=1 Tax=Crepidotus variabilis TaxID=179855 RepID=A0A9P6E729_9AGAR|nr:hypothetical protein CPB83DRAFT_683004 [Crepidotus variabilis]